MITREGLEAFSAEIDGQKAEMIDKLLAFFMTDMMFFWGEEKGLVERQQAVWNPLLQWAEEEFETKFVKVNGLNVPEQDLQSGARIKFFMEGLSSRELTVFYFTTYVTKSVLLAAAFVRKHVNAEQVFEAASLEEVWQQATWGIDDAIERNHKELKEDLGVLEAFLDGN